MLKKTVVISVFSLLILSSMFMCNSANNSKPMSELSSEESLEYYPQTRLSNYTIEDKFIAPYPEITMSDQQVSPSNASLFEKTLSFNLTSPSIEVTFDLASSDIFLAIDGASQSFVLRVNYTIYYPNGTLATMKPVTTTATSPMHFYILVPPIGTWRIVATLIDTGETTAWVQAISYYRGAKWVTELEKQQVHLVSGQNLYFRILLLSTDWFYLYVNKFAGADVQIDLRKQGSYNTPYKSYNNYASEFFPSKSHTPGVYILKIINKGSTDIFVEIVRTFGIRFALNVDSGNTVKSRLQIDLEFFNSTITQSYEWVAFDGAVISSGMTARYLIIDPNMNIIFDSTSSDPSSFKEKMISYPIRGSYYIAIFGSQYAIATIKITSASIVGSIDFIKLDQNWTFTQSGQTFYLKILQSQKYFLFTATTLSTPKVKCTLFNPNLVSLWSWGPSTGLAFYPPTKPTVPFYILKIQGQTNSSSVVHARFQGLEDYGIGTPDCSNYWSRFQGDIIIANLSVRSSDYVIQYAGAVWGNVYVALFDTGYAQKWSRTFSSSRETYFQRWRKGYENPPPGNWLQVVVGSMPQQASILYKLVEISTLQSGDESSHIVTPFQSFETVDWSNWWQVGAYKVDVGSPRWFGIVSQLLTVNMSYQTHPYASIWVYDSSLAELVSGQTADSNNRFRTNFWPDPKPGTWLVVIAGFQWTTWDPLNCSVSYIGEADFHRNWPVNPGGSTNLFYITVGVATFNITIQSNSTVSNLTFLQTSKEIDFQVSGPEGTQGFCIVVIPKQLATGPFSVSIDNQPQSGVLSTENTTHTSLYFTYNHSACNVSIQATWVVPEFPNYLVLPVLLTFAMTATMLARLSRNRKHKHA